MNQNDMEQLARRCGGMMVYSADGSPPRVDGLDLMKFCVALNAYVRLDILRDTRDMDAEQARQEISKGAGL
jgi:hypothetical protein